MYEARPRVDRNKGDTNNSVFDTAFTLSGILKFLTKLIEMSHVSELNNKQGLLTKHCPKNKGKMHYLLGFTHVYINCS